ncbi:MAG: hypothetical protein RLZZ142_1217 [Verrucomicrobiota bacterium]
MSPRLRPLWKLLAAPGLALSFAHASEPLLPTQSLLLPPHELGVGRRVEDLSLETSAGIQVPLHTLAQGKALLIALFQPTCPLSHKLGPELARMEKQCAAQGILPLLLNVSPHPNPESERTFLQKYGLQSAVVRDARQAFLPALRASTSTETFLLDRTLTLVYRGAIHDQYGLDHTKPEPEHHFLREALRALSEGKRPAIEATSAPGCALSLPHATPPPPSQLTYHKDIQRILQNHCVPCHREQGLGPFSLESLPDVLEHAAMIRKQVERGAMPPWFAAKAPRHVWANDTSLGEQDKADLLAWLASDRPQGDPAHAPLPPRFAKEWTLGEPDAVLEMPAPVHVKAEGTMPYQYALLETHFPEDRWVQAYEILPSAPAVVHHVIVSVQEPGAKTPRLNAVEGFWAAYVPGNSARRFPEGCAKRLPAASKLALQIHYTPNGTAMQDRIRIALHFSKSPPRQEVKVTSLANLRLQIPPGAPDHVETAQRVLPRSLEITGYMAHMHVRGKAFKYEVIPPGGKPETLLEIPRYHFLWQLQYSYLQPRLIPAGSTLKATATFDNSSANPANPNPAQTVRWGEQTHDEMMIGYIEHLVPATLTP